MSTPSGSRETHVIVLGAGFAGLAFCRSLHAPGVRITWIDRRNHHLFQPLLYQVATGWLSASDIAQPIRSLVPRRDDIRILLGEVVAIEPERRRVITTDAVLEYDYLVVALGGVPHYFGHPEWERYAPGLKTLEGALRIRSQILRCFEWAETVDDVPSRRRWLTFAVVGGGPTGVELAGALAELTRRVLTRELRRVDPARARILLLEAGPRILPGFSSHLAQWTTARLSAMGVEIRTRAQVTHIGPCGVRLSNGEQIETGMVLWAAGVAAHPLTEPLRESRDGGRGLQVGPDLSLPRYPEVFIIGDMAALSDRPENPVPPLAPAALQMGRYVARILRRELRRRPSSPAWRPPFRYRDLGCMVTVGRGAAIARLGRLELTGQPAWFAWLFVHLLRLVGFRNKLSVLLQWAWAYGMNRPGARILYEFDARKVPSEDIPARALPATDRASEPFVQEHSNHRA